MKIAVSSDLHLDLNHADVDRLVAEQAEYLTKEQVDYYFSLGDTFNDFEKTQHYFSQLQSLTPVTQVYYLAGNHDMLNNITYAELEKLDEPRYFHHRWIDIPQTNWRIIGNNGWYDYTFSTYSTDPVSVEKWKKAYWVDRAIQQPITDQQRMSIVLNQVGEQLTSAEKAGKQVIFMTHFSPIQEAVPQVTGLDGRRTRMWEMTKAMFGSKKLGELLTSFSGVKEVYYGHLHSAPVQIINGGIIYHNVAVGVQRKANHKWKSLADQWINRLCLKEL